MIEIASVFRAPLNLGIALLAVGIVWLLVAAVLSLLFPAGEDDALPSSEGLVPAPADTVPAGPPLVRDLLTRLESLENVPPASASDAAPFDEEVRRLQRDIFGIRHSLAASVLWDEVRTRVDDRVEGLAARARDAVARTARSPEPSPPEPLPDLTPAREALAALGRERDALRARAADERTGLVRRDADLHAAADAELTSLRRSLDALRGDLAALGERGDRLVPEEKALSEERGRLDERRAGFAAEAARTPPADVGVPARENVRLREELEAARRALEGDRTRAEARLARLTRRLERWRQAWQVRLGATEKARESDLQELRQRHAASAALREEEKKRFQDRLAALDAEREGLRSARETFERTVAEPWHRERVERERELQNLEQERAVIESSLRALETQRVSEKSRVADALASARREVRAQQVQWLERWKTLRAETDRDVQSLAVETERLRLQGETEAAIHARAAAEAADAWAKEKAEAEARQADFEARVAAARLEWAARLADAAVRLDGMRKARQDMESAQAAEGRGFEGLLAEQRARARARFDTLERLLEEARVQATTRLNAMRQEKAAGRDALEAQRRRFLEAAAAQTMEFDAARVELARAREATEQTHAGRLSAAAAEEGRLREETERLRDEVSVLEKRSTVLRSQDEKRLRVRQERYEKVLLDMNQDAVREKTAGEGRLAQERMALESLRARVENRRARVEKIVQRRRDELSRLVGEAETALEVARQGHWREARAWTARVEDLREQKDALEETRARLARGPDPAEAPRAEAALDERFAAEKARLAAEAEAYWKDFQETSTAQQDALRKAMTDFERAGQDLERQETAARDVLAAVQGLAANLRTLRDRFKPRGADSSSASNTSVA